MYALFWCRAYAVIDQTQLSSSSSALSPNFGFLAPIRRLFVCRKGGLAESKLNVRKCYVDDANTGFIVFKTL